MLFMLDFMVEKGEYNVKWFMFCINLCKNELNSKF